MIPVADIVAIAQEVAPDVDPHLVTALALIESSGNPYQYKYEPDYRWTNLNFSHPGLMSTSTEIMGQKISWGLMQVMGGTARFCGFKGWFPELIDPKTGIRWGIEYIKWLKARYTHLEDVISAYNAGHPTWKSSDGNIGYVKRVMAKMDELKRGLLDD